MSTDAVVEPYVPPSVAQPSAAERAALQRLTERLRQQLPASFAAAGVSCALVEEPDFSRVPEVLTGGEWAAEAAWAHGGAWRLLLAPGAVAALLAAQLGQDEVREAPLSDLDLRLLQLPVRTLAAELGRALGASGAPPDLRMARGVPDGGGPALRWRARLEHRAHAGEVVLVASWPELQAVLSAGAEPQRMGLDMVAEAAVLVEATLAAPQLTARELRDMQPGDVLIMGAGDRESLLCANGVVFARGRMGAKGTRLAINIQQIEPRKEE